VSILLGASTTVIVQGMGREGRFHAARMKEYGTKVIGGVGPGTGGTERDGFPMFDTVAAAVDATGANASLIFVPAPGAAVTTTARDCLTRARISGMNGSIGRGTTGTPRS